MSLQLTLAGIYKSKTVWAAAALETISEMWPVLSPLWDQYVSMRHLDPTTVQFVGRCAAALMFGLRIVTKQSLANKGAGVPVPFQATVVTPTVDPPVSPTSETKMKTHFLTVIAAAAVGVALLALSGCADITKLEQKITSPSGQVISQITVDLTIGGVIGTGSDAKTKAASIKSVAQKVLTADQGTTVALSALVAVANAQIAQLKLAPAEQAGATLLVTSLSALAANAVAPAPTGTATATSTAVVNVQVIVAQLMNEVITACGGYGA